MPRYYFHVTDGDEVILDEEGVRADALAMAQEQGLTAIAELAYEALQRRSLEYRAAIDIADEKGARLARLEARCAVKIDIFTIASVP